VFERCGTWKRVASWALVALVVVGGCAPGHMAALELDKVAKSLDEFGFASISAPFLAGPTDDFAFDLNRPASYYFEQAFQPQGGVRTLDALAVDTQIAVRANVEQALATIAQFNQARSISDLRAAKRKAAMQRDRLQKLADTLSQPGADGLAPTAPPNQNPLILATIGMLDTIAAQPEPDPNESALPGFTPSSQPVATQPPFTTADRVALSAVGSFTPAAKLPETPYQLTAREALLIASGDVMTQSLLSWFMMPVGNKLGDYELYYCPLVVSVKPGYRTRKDFQCDVTVSVDLARKTMEKGQFRLRFLSQHFPYSDPPIHVAGVFPVIDAQVLDLVSSRRRLYSLAFQLAMRGFGSEANAFVDFARKLESDAKTRSALTTASAYTIGSSSFGFRVEPQFVALTNPAALETGPGDVLESKTFPAMAVLLVHRSYLKPRYWEEACESENKDGQTPINADGGSLSVLNAQYPKKKCKNHKTGKNDGKLTNDSGSDNGPSSAERESPCEYEYLVLRSSVRWSPTKDTWLGPERYSEVDAWKRAAALDKALDWVQGHSSPFTLDDKIHKDTNWLHWRWSQSRPMLHGYQDQQLASRLRTLRQLALDTQALVRVYHTGPADKVVVYDVVPNRGWLDQYTVLTLRGHGFRGNVDAVTVGGILCEHYVANNRTLLVLVPPWSQAKKEIPEDLGSFADAVGLMPGPGDWARRLSPLLETLSGPSPKTRRTAVLRPDTLRDIEHELPSLACVNAAVEHLEQACNLTSEIRRLKTELQQATQGNNEQAKSETESKLKVVQAKRDLSLRCAARVLPPASEMIEIPLTWLGISADASDAGKALNAYNEQLRSVAPTLKRLREVAHEDEVQLDPNAVTEMQKTLDNYAESLRTVNTKLEQQWASLQRGDPTAALRSELTRILEKPARPLASAEATALDALAKKIAEFRLTSASSRGISAAQTQPTMGDGEPASQRAPEVWCEYERLQLVAAERAAWEAKVKLLRERIKNSQDQSAAEQAQWAPVVITSPHPVIAEGCGSNSFPQKGPAATRRAPSGAGARIPVGWVLFDQRISSTGGSGGSGGASGKVIIDRKDGQITGIRTEGNFANGVQLLQLIAGALEQKQDVSLDLNVTGGAQVGAKAAGAAAETKTDAAPRK